MFRYSIRLGVEGTRTGTEGVIDGGRIYECGDCGFVFRRYMENIDFHEFYRNKKEDYFNMLGTGRAKEDRRIIGKIQEYLNGGKILDVGCGTGRFLRKLSPSWEKYGVEPSEYAAILPSDDDLLIHNGLFSDIELAHASYDVITMIDILEHLQYPREDIKKAYGCLKMDGLLVIVTPNIGSIVARMCRDKWGHFNTPDHVSFFSKASLMQLLVSENFDVLGCTSHEHNSSALVGFKLFVLQAIKSVTKGFILSLSGALEKWVSFRLLDVLPNFNRIPRTHWYRDGMIVVARKM